MQEVEIKTEELFYQNNISFDFINLSESNVYLLNKYIEDNLSEKKRYNKAHEKLENKIIQQLNNNGDDNCDLLKDIISIEPIHIEEFDKTIIISK
ncbi:hypothetical protein Glove_499g19 [Diversispora epigaea]|uniref:Uncharacterized protein n=1 Tax=Diversispora epigaea TaxID=1348612 RepID=A0A397GLK9_9GLOM|nr:hypothetical protein Glove_499g19 [Diversispora epigaea]